MAYHLSKFRAVPYIYRWSKEVEHLLPEHYRKRCLEFMNASPTPVHWRPDHREFQVDKYGIRQQVQNVPIKVLFPKECNQGLWGGEGIIRGYVKKASTAPKFPRYWRPALKKQVLYSEILDKYFAITVTDRTLNLIDEAAGFDHYILKTEEADLCSQLGMKLKREMLLALAKKSMHPDDPAKCEKVFHKFKQYAIPEEEAEWVGLPVGEAVDKARRLEAERNPPRPLKELFEQQLLQELLDSSTSGSKESDSGFLQKMNPFASK